MDYHVVKLKPSDINLDGMNVKVEKVSLGGKKSCLGERLSFTLEDELTVTPCAFLYKDALYMVDKQEDNYYECIGITITRLE